MTELEPRFYTIFLQEGEDAFQEALKPELTKNLEKCFRTPSKRQGDLFVTPFQYTFVNCYSFGIKYIPDFEAHFGYKEESRSVFGTRHSFSGQYNEASSLLFALAANEVLKAPNHPEMKLTGVFLIQQNEGLVSPRFAD